jgi:hypothetical protein
MQKEALNLGRTLGNKIGDKLAKAGFVDDPEDYKDGRYKNLSYERMCAQ